MSAGRRIIDLGITIEPAPGPEHQRLEIKYERHENTAPYMMMRFECGRTDLPRRLSYQAIS